MTLSKNNEFVFYLKKNTKRNSFFFNQGQYVKRAYSGFQRNCCRSKENHQFTQIAVNDVIPNTQSTSTTKNHSFNDKHNHFQVENFNERHFKANAECAVNELCQISESESQIFQAIRNASMKLFIRHRAMCDQDFNIGINLRKQKLRVYPGHKACVKELKASLCIYADSKIPLFYTDLVRLPLFDGLNSELIGLMLSRCFFPVYDSLVHSRLFMRNEWFHQLPGGIQFSFMKMKQLSSEIPEKVRGLLCAVQFLMFNDQETALLIPCILTLSLRGWFF
jgi:hypothetical protein